MIKYFDINGPGVSIKCRITGEALRDVKRVVIYAHGFCGHKDNKAAERFAEALLSKVKKCAVLVYDQPCHGSDVKKKLSLDDCDTYLTLVIEYVKNVLKVSEIYAYGTSFGGYLLLKYLHDHGENPFRRIVLRCPAVSMGEVMYRSVLTSDNLAELEKGHDTPAGFDRKVPVGVNFLEGLKNADIRNWEYFDYADSILIVHGSKDEIIPVEEVRDFADNNVIEFDEIPDADHRFSDLDKMKLAHSKMIDFLKTYMRE